MAPLPEGLNYAQWSAVYNALSFGIAGMGADLLWGLLAPKEFYGCREVCEAYRKHVRGPTSPPSSPPQTPGR